MIGKLVERRRPSHDAQNRLGEREPEWEHGAIRLRQARAMPEADDQRVSPADGAWWAFRIYGAGPDEVLWYNDSRIGYMRVHSDIRGNVMFLMYHPGLAAFSRPTPRCLRFLALAPDPCKARADT